MLVDVAVSKAYEANEGISVLDSGEFSELLRRSEYGMVDRGVSIQKKYNNLVLVRVAHIIRNIAFLTFNI